MAGLAPVEVACALGLWGPGAREWAASLLYTLKASPRLGESRQQLRATRVTLEGRVPRFQQSRRTPASTPTAGPGTGVSSQPRLTVPGDTGGEEVAMATDPRPGTHGGGHLLQGTPCPHPPRRARCLRTWGQSSWRSCTT